jgi:large subunit ribosomal protein L24
MKEFSKSWRSSKLPRKQRKFRYKAPLHLRSSLLSSHLSKDLRKKYGRRSIRVRKGDKVRVCRGQFRKREGKVMRVDMKRLKVFVENIDIAKKDGTKAFYPIDPSNLIILETAEDKYRNLQVKK